MNTTRTLEEINNDILWFTENDPNVTEENPKFKSLVDEMLEVNFEGMVESKRAMIDALNVISELVLLVADATDQKKLEVIADCARLFETNVAALQCSGNAALTLSGMRPEYKAHYNELKKFALNSGERFGSLLKSLAFPTAHTIH